MKKKALVPSLFLAALLLAAFRLFEPLHRPAPPPAPFPSAEPALKEEAPPEARDLRDLDPELAGQVRRVIDMSSWVDLRKALPGLKGNRVHVVPASISGRSRASARRPVGRGPGPIAAGSDEKRWAAPKGATRRHDERVVRGVAEVIAGTAAASFEPYLHGIWVLQQLRVCEVCSSRSRFSIGTSPTASPRPTRIPSSCDGSHVNPVVGLLRVCDIQVKPIVGPDPADARVRPSPVRRMWSRPAERPRKVPSGAAPLLMALVTACHRLGELIWRYWPLFASRGTPSGT